MNKRTIKTPTTLIEQGIFVVPPEADDIQPGEPRVFNILMEWDKFNYSKEAIEKYPYADTHWIWRIEATSLEEVEDYFDNVVFSNKEEWELREVFKRKDEILEGVEPARLCHPSKYLKRGTWIQYDEEGGWINHLKIDGKGCVDELDCYLCAKDAWTM